MGKIKMNISTCAQTRVYTPYSSKAQEPETSWQGGGATAMPMPKHSYKNTNFGSQKRYYNKASW